MKRDGSWNGTAKGNKMIHHKIQDWLEKKGFIDRWSLWHYAQGTLFGFVFIQFFGVFESFLANLIVALAWEVWEYYYDDPHFYPFGNNFTDIVLSSIGCLLVAI